MTVVFTSVTTPNSCKHVDVAFTVNGVARSIHLQRSDFTLEPADTDEILVAEMRRIAKAAGATTAAQIKAAVEGQTVIL